MGRFSISSFFCLSVRLSVRPPPLVHPARPEFPPRPEAQPARPKAQPARPEAKPTRPEAQPARSEAQTARSEGKTASQASVDRWVDIQTYGTGSVAYFGQGHCWKLDSFFA